MVVYATMAEPIEMPFGFRTWVGAWNHVLDGAKIPPSEGAILGERRAIVSIGIVSIGTFCRELCKNG